MCNQYLIEENELDIQSNISRKIKIIKIISIEKRWFTFQEISKMLNTSTKTISKDLTYIKDEIPQNCSIEIKKGYGVRLVMPKDISVEEIISIFFKESLIFQVFIQLIGKKHNTVSTMAESLYIQPYQVTKILKKIENIFGNLD
ncbi:helix-turn-helix domain-containing protein [Bacillus thuringiensis]|nr:helix-turn-helix domain-containing protein [Bacillus thuringiensis]